MYYHFTRGALYHTQGPDPFAYALCMLRSSERRGQQQLNYKAAKDRIVNE